MITVPLIMRFGFQSWRIIGGIADRLRSKNASARTMTAVTILWILYALVIPFILIIVWGIVLASDGQFSTQFSLGITLIGLFLLFVFLAFCDWFGHEWLLTGFTVSMFVCATLVSFGYCFMVIFLPSYFTYNGTTAIFMALNFIFSTALTYLKTSGSSDSDNERYVKLDLLVNAIVDCKSFNGDIQSNLTAQKDKLKEVTTKSHALNKRYFLLFKVVAAVAYLCIFIAYFIVIIAKNPKEYKLVGLMHVILIMITDQVIYRLENDKQSIYVREWFKCIYQFVTRFICCLLLDYWLCMESIAFFITLMIVALNLTEKLLPKPEQVSASKTGASIFDSILSSDNPQSSIQQDIIKLCRENPQFQAYVEAQVPDIVFPASLAQKPIQQSLFQKLSYLYLSDVIAFVYICIFIAIAAGSAKAQTMIFATELTFENNFGQWVIPLFSLIFSILIGLFYAWFRYFQICKYQTSWKLYSSLAIIEVVSIALGFVFYGLLHVRVHLIWTSFAILPAVTGTFLLFIGNWISNDYFFYQPKTTSDPSGIHKIEPGTVEPIVAQNKAESSNARLQEIGKQTFCSELWTLVKCGYFPRNGSSKDKMQFYVVIANVCLLVVYTILTSFVFQPWWVGFTIGMWISVFQLTLVIFIRFYQTYYQMNFMVQFSMLLNLIIFAAWTIIMAIYVFTVYNNNLVALIAFCLAAGGYIFMFAIFLGCLKYLTLTDKTIIPLGLRLIFSFAFSLIGLVGILILIVSEEAQVWGSTMIGISVYVIVLFNLPLHRLKVSIAFAFVLFGYAIFAIIFYNKQNGVVLQALSVILIVIFLYFFISFVRKFYENRQLESSQIFIYSRTLFPAMKYLYSEQKIISSNSELVYFCLAALTFFIWSFLAGILFRLQDRYIGISLMAISISVIYLYVSDRLKKASFLESHKFQLASLQFYTSAIGNTLERKQQWRMDFMQQKQLKSAAASVLPTQETVEKELHLYEQWNELYQVHSAQLNSKVTRQLFFSRNGKARDANFLFSDSRVSDQELAMKDAITPEKQVDALLRTQVIMQKELLFDIEFYAFLNAYMHLKIKNVEDDLKNAVQKWKAIQNAPQQPPSSGPAIMTETVFPRDIPVQMPDPGTKIIDDYQKQKDDLQKQQEIEEQMKRIKAQEQEIARRKIEEQKRQEEDQKRRQQAFFEEEAKRKAQDQQQQQQEQQQVVSGMGQVIQGIMVKEKSEDEQYLQQEGDRVYQQSGNGLFKDPQFSVGKALAANTEKLGWTRIRDIIHKNDKSGNPVSDITIFDKNGINCTDIKQGTLGDCYLLSAMSVLAHSRPELIQKIFHPRSRDYQDSTGLYTLMFFRNRKPVVITIDDSFPTDQRGAHSYVQIASAPDTNKEVWPMLVEKAYAKMYGSYPNIEGGLVDEALADLTNGAPYRFDLSDPDVQQMYNSGEFWNKMVFWSSKNYLMGAGSPSGSDADVSPLGIVQGHAYSILDVMEIEGTKLMQLRNPWGDETEWKGAWGDSSKEWTERRKRIVYDRMQQRGFQKEEIGANDGIFWMSIGDFFKNFDQLFLCRFFSEEYTEIKYNSEWSKAKGTAGGCCNFNSVGSNPQLQIKVTGSGPVEIFCFLQVEEPEGGGESKSGIGFQIYDLKGKGKIVDRRMPEAVLENNKGYCVARSVSLDSKIKPLAANPYTLLITTFDANVEAKFNFTIWFNKNQGTVELTEFK